MLSMLSPQAAASASAKTRSFDFYEDPGHGWLKVPRKLLRELRIEDKVSSYSFQYGDFAYLEEDCDMTLFEQAMAAAGWALEYRRHTTDRTSRIRGYRSFEPKP